MKNKTYLATIAVIFMLGSAYANSMGCYHIETQDVPPSHIPCSPSSGSHCKGTASEIYYPSNAYCKSDGTYADCDQSLGSGATMAQIYNCVSDPRAITTQESLDSLLDAINDNPEHPLGPMAAYDAFLAAYGSNLDLPCSEVAQGGPVDHGPVDCETATGHGTCCEDDSN